VNLTMRQIGPLFGVSHSAAHRAIDSLGPLLARAPVRRRRSDQVAIVDGTLVPLRDHRLAAPSKNYRYSANLQVAIDADTRLVIALDRPRPGNHNDRTAYRDSGINQTLAGRPVIADGGYQGNAEVIMPFRKPGGDHQLPDWKTALNTRQASPRSGRARAVASEVLENPARLPPRGHHSPRHRIRHRLPAQHRPRALTPDPHTDQHQDQLRNID
jgi:hypothetical protein